MRPLPIGSMAASEIYQLGKLSFTWLSVDKKTSSRTSSPRKSWWRDFLETARFVWGVFFWPRQLGRLKSEIVRLQKVLEDTQDYLGLPQDNQNAFTNRKTSGPKDFNSQKITRLRITASQKKNNCSKSKMVLTNVRSNVWRLSDSVFSAFRIKSMPSPMSSWEEMRSWTSELPPFFFH